VIESDCRFYYEVRSTDAALPDAFLGFEFTSYPTGDIPVEGELLAVDDPAFDWTNTIFLEANGSITLRMDERKFIQSMPNFVGPNYVWNTDVD
jgi:hypothetical protein